MSIFCCMREPMETTQSLGDDTHAVVTLLIWASGHGQHTVCGFICRWVASLAVAECSNKETLANVIVRPRQLESANWLCFNRKTTDTTQQNTHQHHAFSHNLTWTRP